MNCHRFQNWFLVAWHITSHKSDSVRLYRRITLWQIQIHILSVKHMFKYDNHFPSNWISISMNVLLMVNMFSSGKLAILSFLLTGHIHDTTYPWVFLSVTIVIAYQHIWEVVHFTNCNRTENYNFKHIYSTSNNKHMTQVGRHTGHISKKNDWKGFFLGIHFPISVTKDQGKERNETLPMQVQEH